MEKYAKGLISHRPQPIIPKKVFPFGFVNMKMLDENGINNEWIGSVTPWGSLFKNYLQNFNILSVDSNFSLSFIKKWAKNTENNVRSSINAIDVDFDVDIILQFYF